MPIEDELVLIIPSIWIPLNFNAIYIALNILNFESK